MELKATTVGGYLRELPADRRVAMARVWSMIRRSARGVRERMRYGSAFCELDGPIFALESTEKTMTLFIAEPSVVENYKDSVKGVLADRSAICFDDLNRIPLDSLEKIVRDSVAARRERVKTTPAPTQKELLELWKITEEEAKAPPPIVRIQMGKVDEVVQQVVKGEVEEPEKPVEILRAPTFKDPAMTASSQPKNPALKKVAAPAKSPIRRRAPRKTAAAAEDTTAKPKRTRRTKAKTAEE